MQATSPTASVDLGRALPTSGCSSSRWARAQHRRPTQADLEERSVSTVIELPAAPSSKPRGRPETAPG